MRNLILTVIMIFALTVVLTDAKSEKQSLHITSLTIQFDKTYATFTVDYDFGKLPRLYIMLIGAKNLEPEIRSVFSRFDYEIIKLDQDKAILRVKNISRLNEGYYLHDSIKFGETMKAVYIYTPDSPNRREYYDIDSTPYFFYR